MPPGIVPTCSSIDRLSVAPCPSRPAGDLERGLGGKVSTFTDFEREVVTTLLGPHMDADRVATVLDDAGIVSYEHTGAGYFLTVRHRILPSETIVCHTPLVVGTCGDVACGFVVFLEHGELTLECHALGDAAIPEDFRDRRVRIERAA